MAEPHQEIADIEAELDDLEMSSERSRKIVLLGQYGATAGILLLIVAIWRTDAVGLVTGTLALLGGLSLAGSTRTTRTHEIVKIAALEAKRAEIINELDTWSSLREPNQASRVVGSAER